MGQKEQGSEQRRLHTKRPKPLLEKERVHICQLAGVVGLVVMRRARALADGQLSMPTDRPEKQLKEQLKVQLHFEKDICSSWPVLKF